MLTLGAQERAHMVMLAIQNITRERRLRDPRTLSVRELAEASGESFATVWRGLNDLEKFREVQKTRGGYILGSACATPD